MLRKKKPKKRRNEFAFDLLTNKLYRAKKIANKKLYKRKKRNKERDYYED